MTNIRTTKPGAGDKYFIRKANGGFSSCIQGKPTDANCNVLANCVGYACGAFNEECDLGYEKYWLNCNAENFVERAIALGLSVVKEPVVGGILVWQKGATLSGNDGAGHVAICTSKPSATQIRTAESGYGSTAFWTATRNKGNGDWGAGSGYTYRGCIVNPYYKEPVAVDPFPGVSDEELARRVWTGEFGNGQDRKNALGIRYDAVQALVDQGVGKPEEPKPTPTPKPAKDTEIHDGDTVIVTGIGTASSDGSGAKTRKFTKQPMKVIGIAGNTSRPNRYALNQYNRGTVHDWSAVTAWFSGKDIKK